MTNQVMRSSTLIPNIAFRSLSDNVKEIRDVLQRKDDELLLLQLRLGNAPREMQEKEDRIRALQLQC